MLGTAVEFNHFFFRLFIGLMALILGGFVSVVAGNEAMDTAIAIFGALLFSGKYKNSKTIVILAQSRFLFFKIILRISFSDFFRFMSRFT